MTIKEMAREYGKVNYIVRYTADGEKEIDEETGAEFFEDGANYVLEEIEKLVKFNRWSAQDLYELIEQLKK